MENRMENRMEDRMSNKIQNKMDNKCIKRNKSSIITMNDNIHRRKR